MITDVTEVFVTYLQLSYFIANQITFIFICYHIFVFISTGLYQFEYVYFKNIIIKLAKNAISLDKCEHIVFSDVQIGDLATEPKYFK